MLRVTDRLDKLLETPGEWTIEDMTDLTVKTAIVTGANGGLGKQIALDLARHKCKVILVCRDSEKSNQTAMDIRAIYPEADLMNEYADFTNLASVLEFTERMLALNLPISLLFNNAGVLDLPIQIDARDGLDATFKTNYLSHFLLTCNILPLLSNDARIIFTGSTHHKYANINFDDIQTLQARDNRMPYNNSKWMLLSFCMELQRRLAEFRPSILCVAAHPGFTATNILTSTTGKDTGFFKQMGFRLINSLVGQKPEKGVLPLLYAAMGLNVKGGDYYGPDGMSEYSGKTHKTECIASVYDQDNAFKLWRASEMLLQMALAAHHDKRFSVPDLVARDSQPNKIRLN